MLDQRVTDLMAVISAARCRRQWAQTGTCRNRTSAGHTLLVLAGDPPNTASAQAAMTRLSRWDGFVNAVGIEDRGGVGDPGLRARIPPLDLQSGK